MPNSFHHLLFPKLCWHNKRKPNSCTILLYCIIDLISLTEFSFLIRYYNLLYQSLIPNCKLTIKTLKQHLEIPNDVESFIVNGESSRIRCQRIINLLLVQLDTTRDYKHFCDLFNKISVMNDLTDKLRTGTMLLIIAMSILILSLAHTSRMHIVFNVHNMLVHCQGCMRCETMVQPFKTCVSIDHNIK